jgi:hypothetical protein
MRARAERAIIGVIWGFLVVMLALATTDFNIWGPSQVFEVTPTGVLYYQDGRGTSLVKVTEWGKMGVFKLCGDFPTNMTPGVSYGFRASRGLWGHRTSPARFIYKVLDWWVVDT